MSECYVLLEGTPYEGDTLLGVYSSLSSCREARDDWLNRGKMLGGWLDIFVIPLDAPPAYRVSGRDEIQCDT